MTLEDRIKAAGMSNTELSRQSGVSRQTIWKARCGKDVDWDSAKALARVLGCQAGDICAKFAEAAA